MTTDPHTNAVPANDTPSLGRTARRAQVWFRAEAGKPRGHAEAERLGTRGRRRAERNGRGALLLDIRDVVPGVADAQVEEEGDEREREEVAAEPFPDHGGRLRAEERDGDPDDREHHRRGHPRRAAVLLLRAVLIPAEGRAGAPRRLGGSVARNCAPPDRKGRGRRGGRMDQ